jgi:outer membrane receptor for ferrienterochelin and colicins
MKRWVCILLILPFLMDIFIPGPKVDLSIHETSKQEVLYFTNAESKPIKAEVKAENTSTHQVYYVNAEHGKVNLPASGDYKLEVKATGYIDYHAVINLEQKAAVKIVLEKIGEKPYEFKKPEARPVPVPLSVAGTRVIQSFEIRSLAIQNLDELLRIEQGSRTALSNEQVKASGYAAPAWDLSNGKDISIYIDGVPYLAEGGDLSSISLSNAVSVTITQDPGDISGKPGNTIINIQSNSSAGAKNDIGFQSYYENIGTYLSAITFSTGHKGLHLNMAAERKYFDGWSPAEPYEMLPKSHLAGINRVKMLKPELDYHYQLNISYTLKKWSFAVSGKYSSRDIMDRGMPFAPYYDYAFDRHYFYSHSMLSGIAEYKFRQDSKFSTQLYYSGLNARRNTIYRDLTSPEESITENKNDQDTSRLSISGIRMRYASVNKYFSYKAGLEAESMNLHQKAMVPESYALSELALFASASKDLTKDISVNAGLRAGFSSVFKTALLPFVNAAWKGGTRNNVNFSFSTSNRNPALQELYLYQVNSAYSFSGNPLLKPEHSYQLALAYDHSRLFRTHFMQLQTRIFSNTYSDFITVALNQNTPGNGYSFANISRYQAKGASASVDMRRRNAELMLGAGVTGIRSALDKGDGFSTLQLSPELSAKLGYGIEKWKTSISLAYKYNGSMPGFILQNDMLMRQRMEAYHWADLGVTKLVFKQLQLGAGIKNIFNVQNITSGVIAQEHFNSSLPVGAGRIYYFSLYYNLKP